MTFKKNTSSSGDSYTLTDGSSLTGDVVIPSTIYTEEDGFLPVTSIGEKAFYGNTKIDSIDIDNGIEDVNYEAFYGCSNIKSMHIPESITNIDYGAFFLCYSLASFSVDSNNKNYCVQNGIIYSKDMSALVVYPSGKTDKIYNLPTQTTKILSTAICTNPYVEEVIIHKNVIDIEVYNLIYMNSLKKISVSNENNCFTDIDGVLYSKDMSVLYAYPSQGNSNYTIPNSVTTILTVAFGGVTSKLAYLEIPSTVTSIRINRISYENIGSYNRKLKTVVCASQYIVNRMFIAGTLIEGEEYDSVRVIQYADTVYIKTGLSTTKATYLTKYFTKQSSSDKTGYDKWIRTSS